VLSITGLPSQRKHAYRHLLLVASDGKERPQRP
jgi:hypothetical protein